MNGKHFLILDIDGVLLESHGYRTACIDTINDFLRQMGQPYLSVDRRISDTFEASGISAEWDIIPLTLAAFTNWYCEKYAINIRTETFPPDLGQNQIQDNSNFHEMLLEKIGIFSEMLDPGKTPVDAINETLAQRNGKGFEALWAQPFRDRFFVDTLNPWKSPYFAALENMLLGTDVFTDFYGMAAPVQCESYLVEKDRLLVSEYYREFIPMHAGKTIFPAVMTYRPTLLPSDGGNKDALYYVNTPEGECALRLLRWNDGKVGMIGAGSLCYIESKYGLRREYYVKPHPFHALAAMVMALCGNELKSLEIARKLCEDAPQSNGSPLSEWIPLDEDITLSVFEDSVSGIESTRNAAEVLRSWNYKVDVNFCGIHSTEAKDLRLKKTGAVLYPDINSALDDILEK